MLGVGELRKWRMMPSAAAAAAAASDGNDRREGRPCE